MEMIWKYERIRVIRWRGVSLLSRGQRLIPKVAIYPEQPALNTL